VTEPDELEIESKGAAPGTFDAITAKAAPAIRAIEKLGIIGRVPALVGQLFDVDVAASHRSLDTYTAP
jgi:hypothetical protein